MSSRVRGVSSSLLDSFTLGGFMRTAFLGAAFGVLGSLAALGTLCSFLGRPRFLGSGRIGLLSGSVATGGSSTRSGGAPQRFLKLLALPLGSSQAPARPQAPD